MRKFSWNFFRKRFFDPKKSKIFSSQKWCQNGQNVKIWPNCRIWLSVRPTTPICDNNLEKLKIVHFDPMEGDPKNEVKVAKMSKVDQMSNGVTSMNPDPSFRRFGRKTRKLLKEKQSHPKWLHRLLPQGHSKRLNSVADQTKNALMWQEKLLPTYLLK